MLKRNVESTRFAAPAAPRQQPRAVGPARSLQGRLQLTPRGFGFILTDAGASYFLKASLTRGLVGGDRLEFLGVEQCLPDSAGTKLEAVSVVRVTRLQQIVLGEVFEPAQGTQLKTLRADDPCGAVLQLRNADALDVGDVVAVSVPAYDGGPPGHLLAVDVLCNLGKRNAEGFLPNYATWRYGFQDAVPALPAGIEVNDEGRVDMERLPFVTIDADSSTDLDDALYVEATEHGWRCYVAISDVSSFIKPGSSLDEWAAQRGTSVYLPGQHLPMLPHELSSGECSLLPGVARRAVVLQLDLSPMGEVLATHVYRAWVRMAARLSYDAVARYFYSADAQDSLAWPAEVRQSVQAMHAVYQALSALRDMRGRLDFEDAEPKLVQAEDGAWNLVWENRNEAHKVVEEFMLLANQVVAGMLMARYGEGLVRRQLPPDSLDWDVLRQWAASRGYELPEQPSMQALAGLAKASTCPDYQALASMKIRSVMRPASYHWHDGVAHGGHFSLGYACYTHFTSPIRRYADLMVHRLLLREPGPWGPEELAALQLAVERCSNRSQAARAAERYMWEQLKMQTLVRQVDRTTVLRGRVIRTSLQGARIALQGWQLLCTLNAEELKAGGYRWDRGRWVSDQASCAVVEEGVQLEVAWKDVSSDRPAFPVLLVGLTASQAE